MKTVLIIVSNLGFQDHEFWATYEALINHANITIAAKRRWECFWVFWKKIIAEFSIDEVIWSNYDLVIFIWWWWTLNTYIHNKDYLRLAKEAKKIWAICIAPMIVSESWIFEWKLVTSWDEDGNQKNFIEKNWWIWVNKPVVYCENIVTANWPESAVLFWEECVKLLNM